MTAKLGKKGTYSRSSNDIKLVGIGVEFDMVPSTEAFGVWVLIFYGECVYCGHRDLKPRNEVFIDDLKCEPWRVSDTNQKKNSVRRR